MLRVLACAAGATAAAGAVAAPEQVRLSLTHATSAMHVFWATNNETTPADYAGVVQWGEMTPTNEASAVTSTYSIFGYQASRLHNAVMSPLTESTIYFYRVGSERDGWSQTFNFSTAPPAGTTRQVRGVRRHGNPSLAKHSGADGKDDPRRRRAVHRARRRH